MINEIDDIIINLTVTDRCYARCRDCINRSLTFREDGHSSSSDRECDPGRDSALILRIAEKHAPKTVTVCFYGGEPFLDPEKMDRTRALLNCSDIGDRIRYMVYTTGELIEGKIEGHRDLISGMWLYSVSIDGTTQQHESVRPGTSMANTIRSLQALREVYSGNILVWSTLREEQSLLDCFQQFMSMRSLGLADHFFWHWADTVHPFHDLSGYARAYEEDLECIMGEYVSWICRGEILPIAHVNDLILYYLEGKQRGHTACGVEMEEHYDVVGGRVHACADLPASFGAYSEGGSVEIPGAVLRSLVGYKEKLGCGHCEAHWYCGGRCPVQAMAGSHARTEQICILMRLHVRVVGRHMKDIENMMDTRGISRQRIYDRSASMARYTDVVP